MSNVKAEFEVMVGVSGWLEVQRAWLQRRALVRKKKCLIGAELAAVPDPLCKKLAAQYTVALGSVAVVPVPGAVAAEAAGSVAGRRGLWAIWSIV